MGQITRRYETSAASTNPNEFYFYFDGLKVGDNGNNGTSDIDYAASIGNRASIAGAGPFRGGSLVGNTYADFSQSYDPINPGSTAPTASSYTVNEGDTLQSVARTVWGDASLWYLIADANGLSSVGKTGTHTLYR